MDYLPRTMAGDFNTQREKKMHVLVIGSGGREHALAWAVSRSLIKPEISCAPGNAGTESLGKNIDLDTENTSEIVDYCKSNNVDLVIVGPEAPLVAGIADDLRDAGIAVFGPGAGGAILEGSKVFAKQFCDRNGIPTAKYKVFEDPDRAHKYIDKNIPDTSVVKADGLAAGKGAIVCDDPIDAHAAVDTILVEKKFGKSGNQVIIEQRLEGFETTLMTIVSGSDYIKLPYSQDHKRAFDGDKGPNTGGMGVFAPTPKVTAEINERIEREIVKPTIEGLVREGIDYVGCLYFGLMMTGEGPALIEFNCRFGDPESQAVLPLMEGDFLETLDAATRGNLGQVDLKMSNKKSLVVILASEGYPEKYKKGVDITRDLRVLEDNPELIIFHAGTRLFDDKLYTSGGRVFAVTSLGEDFRECRIKAYDAINARKLKGLFYRKDIGWELVPVS